MLGHAKASMTLDVYADLFDEHLDTVANRLDDAIRFTADQERSVKTSNALTSENRVELRGFEPLTYSMRTSTGRPDLRVC